MHKYDFSPRALRILHCPRIFPIMPNSRTSYRDLKILYQKQAKHTSHYNFIALCLKNNGIPRGLKITIQPQVPKSNLKCELVKMKLSPSRNFSHAFKIAKNLSPKSGLRPCWGDSGPWSSASKYARLQYNHTKDRWFNQKSDRQVWEEESK